MKRISIGILLLLFCCCSLTLSQAAPQPCIGVLGDHIDKAELDVATAVLHARGWHYEVLHWRQLRDLRDLQRFTALWVHRTDTSAIDEEEKDKAALVRIFVMKGGQLLLSMEAMPLLNAWKIESGLLTMRQDTVKDEGFGRPLGFHGFRQHPVFDSLQGGGVYCSKRPNDHLARKWGYFGPDTPREGKVIGIQWTYITFTEDNKLLLEYRLGKGCIVAAGAYLYYSANNYNRAHLQRLTSNIFMYMNGRLRGKKQYWATTPRTIVQGTFSDVRIPQLPVVHASRWQLSRPSLQRSANKGSNAFYDLTGRRIAWMGRLNGGAEEIWTHPFMAIRDLAIGVRMKGADSVSWLRNMPCDVTVTPEYLVRTYRMAKAVIREIYTVSFNDPCGVAHIETEGQGVEGIVVSYASNLRLMWPYSPSASGNIQYGFCGPANGHIVTGPDDAMSAAVLYSERPVRQSCRVAKDSGQVDISAEFRLPADAAVNLYILGEEGGWRKNLQTFRRVRGEISRLFEKSGRYYKDLLNHHLGFETPDSLFNEGYRWALARTDQFLQTTPGVGTALMAGFGTTARGWNGGQFPSGRPGYAWYFGRDGEWSAMAVDAYGDLPMVKKMLETLIRYQDVSGKIYHELSSSGAVHYDASDATPLFVVLAMHYLRYSGDTMFIRRSWPVIRKAMDFCYSTDTDGDGLIENTNVGHGWIEGGILYGTHTEFYLAACWASALESAARMAACVGANGLAGKYQADAGHVRQIIRRDFWNPDANFFYNGKMKDGSYMPDATVLAAVAVYLHTVDDSAQAEAVSRRISGSAFSTDWGIRMIEDTNPHYKAGSYHAGMVWPLYAGWAALADFGTGRYAAGFQHIMNNLLHYRNWSPGSIEETFNGDRYVPNGVCSHQCWSEAMVLLPAIEGMLGLEVDATRDHDRLAPWFPWDWRQAKITSIPLYRTPSTAMMMVRRRGSTVYHFTCTASRELDFQPAFPPGTTGTEVLSDGRCVPFTTRTTAEGVVLGIRLQLHAGDNRVEFRHTGGIGLLPAVAYPVPGTTSSGVQLISQHLDQQCFSAVLEGRSGDTCTVRLICHEKIARVEHAMIVSHKEGLLILQALLPADASKKYTRTEVRLYLKK